MRFLIFVAALWVPLFSLAQVCAPDVDSCGFYVCQEKKHNCGPNGYPLGFGFKFCRLFLNTEKNHSPETHAWLRRVRVCLMHAMNELDSPGMTCKKIRNEGFHSHLGCYLETGFCELTLRERLRISWVMRTSFIHREVLRDGLAVMRACSSKKEPSPVGPVGLR